MPPVRPFHAQDPVAELIITSARRELGVEGQASLKRYATLIKDWQQVMRIASIHGLTCLLYYHLKQTCPNSVPQIVLNAFQNSYTSNTKQNLSNASLLLRILKSLHDDGIPAIPFKGPVLATQAYGDIGLRQYGDLDILVRRSDVIRAKNLLTCQGFEEEIRLTGKQAIKFLEYENSITLFHKKKHISVDLHWEMTGRYLLDPIYFEYFEPNLRDVSLLGKSILTVPDDVMLIYLCIHATSHCWERLEWLSCFVELLRQQHEEKLSNIVELAKKMRCQRMIYLGFYLGYALLDLQLPSQIEQQVFSDKGVIRYGRHLKRSIFRPCLQGNHGDAKWRFSPLHIFLRDSISDRIRYARNLLFMPTIKEWEFVRLPIRLTPLYGLLRPLRLGTVFFIRVVFKTLLKRAAC